LKPRIYLLFFDLSGMEWSRFGWHDRSEFSTVVLVLEHKVLGLVLQKVSRLHHWLVYAGGWEPKVKYSCRTAEANLQPEPKWIKRWTRMQTRQLLMGPRGNRRQSRQSDDHDLSTRRNISSSCWCCCCWPREDIIRASIVKLLNYAYCLSRQSAVILLPVCLRHSVHSTLCS